MSTPSTSMNSAHRWEGPYCQSWLMWLADRYPWSGPYSLGLWSPMETICGCFLASMTTAESLLVRGWRDEN